MNSFVRRLKLPFHYGKLLLLILQCKLLLLAALAANRFRVKTILTLPHKPYPHEAFYKFCHRLGYTFTQDAHRHADLIIRWQDSIIQMECEILNKLARGQRVINYQLADFSKRHIAEVFQQVFGYSLQINPREYHGPIVRKSNSNGPHDGTIFRGPIAEDKPEFAYQKLVNNVVAGYLQDIRVPIFGDIIPYCFVKRIPIEHRFNNKKGTGVIREVNEVLAQEEIAAIKRFCRAVGLDYGELDVLRDSDEERLYIVDVNNTPYGPIDGNIQVPWYFTRISWNALGRMCEAFRVAFTTDRPGDPVD